MSGDIRQELPKPLYAKLGAAMRGARLCHQHRAHGLLCYAFFKPEGDQNKGLNYSAFRFRELIDLNAIAYDDAEALLLEVAGRNGFIARHSQKEAEDTVRSGLGEQTLQDHKYGDWDDEDLAS
jgi:hypothetical protein